MIVSAHLGDHRDAIGAGVIVARIPYGIRVVTAKHVIRVGNVTVWIARIGYPADVVRTFEHRDLAIVDAVIPREVRAAITPATLGSAGSDADPIVVWGEDDAGPRKAEATIVSTRYAALGDAAAPPLLAIDCARCAHGDSGGGIFSATGNLIGILVARYQTPDHRIVATVGERIDPSLFASADTAVEATAADPASTVRSQNAPKLSPD